MAHSLKCVRERSRAKIRICSNVRGGDRAGYLNSLECERKRSHGNIQICSNMGGGNSAGYLAAGGRVDA